MTYSRPYIAISIILLCTLACGFQLPASTPTPQATPQATATYVVGNTTYSVLTVCRTPYLNVRTGAGEEYPRKSWLEEGAEVVKITETYSKANRVWYVIALDDGIGYINSRYVCE